MRRTSEQIEDELLVLRFQAGESEALHRLVRRWHERLWRFAAYKLGDTDGALDAVQDAWLAIARGLRSLDDPASFGPWSRRIVANKCADAIRRRRRERPQAHDPPAPARLQPEQCATDELGALRRALRRLPTDARAILYLHYAQGLGVRSIASLLEIPEGTVKSRLHALRAELRRTIERNDP